MTRNFAVPPESDEKEITVIDEPIEGTSPRSWIGMGFNVSYNPDNRSIGHPGRAARHQPADIPFAVPAIPG